MVVALFGVVVGVGGGAPGAAGAGGPPFERVKSACCTSSFFASLHEIATSAISAKKVLMTDSSVRPVQPSAHDMYTTGGLAS